MLNLLFYLVFSLSLFGSVLVKVIVSQWKISSQISSSANYNDLSNYNVPSFFVQVFEGFFNSKFNIFAFINLLFALTYQIIVSSLIFFLDGLTSTQKMEANKKFISMFFKDLFFPLLILTPILIEYSYLTNFMFILPVPFLIRYLIFLTRSFIDGLSLSSKAKKRNFHQKLFAFQVGLFSISYIFFIYFLNYYFYPNKFIHDDKLSQNGSGFSKSSLHHSFITNLSHESKLRKNLQYIVERIALLKARHMQKNEEAKRIKEMLGNSQNKNVYFSTDKESVDVSNKNDKNSDDCSKKQSEGKIIDENTKNTHRTQNKDEIYNNHENQDQNTNVINVENEKDNTDFTKENIKSQESSYDKKRTDFYSDEDTKINEAHAVRNSIFIFLSFQCCFALADNIYDIVRHIIFVSDFENYGSSEKSINRNYINDVIYEIIKIIIEIAFFFFHISYVIINLNNSDHFANQFFKIRKFSNYNLNISFNSSFQSISNLSEISSTNSYDFLTITESSNQMQKEIIGIVMYTPFFVIKTIILNAFFLSAKVISYKKWKEMSNAIKNNLPDANEEDMRHEMRCIICRLDMCTCRHRKRNEKSQNQRKLKKKVRKVPKDRSKAHGTPSNQDSNHNTKNETLYHNTNNNILINSEDMNYGISNVNNTISTNDNFNSTDNNFNDADNNFEINHANNSKNINNSDTQNIYDSNSRNTYNDNDCLNINNDQYNENSNKKINIDNEEEYEYEYENSDENQADDEIEYIIRKGDIKKLPCGHCFHAQCLQNWAQRQMKCPLCQYNLKNILNKSIMLIHQLHPEIFRNNNERHNIHDLRQEIAPNMFIPPEFIRNDGNRNENANEDNLEIERRNFDLNDNEHFRAIRILTHVLVALTFVMFIILIVIMVFILMDLIGF